MKSPLIRPAIQADAAELTELTAQLGYPSSMDILRSRLAKIIASSNDILLVAETSDGELAGWIHGFQCQMLESGCRVEIGGLVVDEKFRRNGIGRQLVESVELWACDRGIKELSVRCRDERTESHRFYESLNFKHTKTQRVFRKPTNPQ